MLCFPKRERESAIIISINEDLRLGSVCPLKSAATTTPDLLTKGFRQDPDRERNSDLREHGLTKTAPIATSSLSKEICARLKYDLYDFFRGCFGAFYTRKRT